ncbi:MAG: hypothetical protein DRJ52_05055 [Thermoprotei archaeon]|nr:MAG: hypothetical protein DRJ52_05055 [Thermoprotei archaeon]
MRLGVVFELKSLGFWGVGRESFEADAVTCRQKLPTGVEVLGIRGAYVKGLLRNKAYLIAPLLEKVKALSSPVSTTCYTKKTCGRCAVCKVFGYSGSALSPLAVSDFYSVKAENTQEIYRIELEKALLTKPELFEKPPIVYVTRVKIHDLSQRAAEGGLYTYEHVSPGALFYGEIRLREKLLDKISYSEACLLVLLSLASLKYFYAGRRTRIYPSIVGYEPSELMKHDLIKIILDKLKR